MDRGTYIAASGGFAQLLKLQIVSNNLANVSTPGFKREILRGDVQTFEQTLASQIAPNDPYARGDQERTPGVVSVHAETDFAQGPIQDTGNPLDVALRNPKDFFVVLTPNGPRYTRAGNFTLGQNGQLVTADGMPVSGDGGAINLPKPPSILGMVLRGAKAFDTGLNIALPNGFGFFIGG